MELGNVVGIDTVTRDDHLIPEEDRLRSSSVSSSSSRSRSSDFSFEDTYQLAMNAQGSFILEHEHEQSEPISSGTTTQGSTSPLENPPFQVMERPSDAPVYRIPSSVFARNKSSNPNPDWSAASNDSLFSIHTGNMSYTKDQFSWLLKSGDLGIYTPGDIRKSGELPPLSPKLRFKSGEKMPPIPSQTTGNHFKAPVPARTPSSSNRPVDVHVIKCPPKANEGVVGPNTTDSAKKVDFKPEIQVIQHDRSLTPDEGAPSVSPSRKSDTSLSFAFPVLAEMDKDRSVNSGQSQTEQQPRSLCVDEEASKEPETTPAVAPASSSLLSSWFSCCFRS